MRRVQLIPDNEHYSVIDKDTQEVLIKASLDDCLYYVEHYLGIYVNNYKGDL